MSAACSGWLGAANSCSDTAAIMPDRWRPLETADHRWSAAWATFWNPTGR